MERHFEKELNNLKATLEKMTRLAQESLAYSTRALLEDQSALAERTFANEREINNLEIVIDHAVADCFALFQPVAVDLRFLLAILKINNDLERIGDLAVNIAERATYLASREPVEIPFDFVGMAAKTKLMLKRSLDALVNMDSREAQEVCAMDDDVDAMNRKMYEQVQDGIRQRPDQMESLIHCLSTSRHLERIADHATNIAEDVIYMVAGEIVRHHAEDYRPPQSKPA